MKKSSQVSSALLVAAFCIALTATIGWCRSGDIDRTFGKHGSIALPYGELRAVAFDGNTGAIEAVGGKDGDQLLVRIVDGQLDPNFGNHGVVVNHLTRAGAGLAVLPDSKIATVGHAGNRISISRYEVNGAQDSSFGSKGTVFKQVPLTYGHDAKTSGLAAQPDGKFVAVGYALPDDLSTHTTKMLLARFNLDGTPDDSFGIDGLVATDLGMTGSRSDPGRVYGRAVALQSNGDIVVVGSTRKFPQASFVARFLPNGNLDSGFGNNGIVENSACAFADAVAINPDSGDDRIVVAGSAIGPRPCVLRLTPDGKLDNSFNSNGVLIVDTGNRRGEVQAITVSDGSNGPSGQIVAGGWLDTSQPDLVDFLLARVNPDGLLDTTFGVGGLVRTHWANGINHVQGITFSNGTIVVSGFSVFSEEIHARIARYLQ